MCFFTLPALINYFINSYFTKRELKLVAIEPVELKEIYIPPELKNRYNMNTSVFDLEYDIID
jgi:hypothetical protein